LSSDRTCIQNFAPSDSWNHIPRTSREPHRDPEREIARPPLNAAAITDLEHQRVEEDDRVDVLQRPLLPRRSVVHHRVGDAADQIAPDMHTVDVGQVRLDIPRRQPPEVQRQDLVVKPLKAPLALADDLRRKAAVAITRRVDPDLPVLGDQRLRCRPVARVARSARWLLVAVIADVIGQLDLQRPLHQPLGQLRKQTARTDDLLLGPSSRQQLVNDVVRKLATQVIRHLTQDPRRGRRLLA
jgi:hypothetical protein